MAWPYPTFNRWTWSFFLLGLTSVSVQLLFFRELSVVFYGNELSLGLMLGLWLLATGTGSALAGRLFKTSTPFALSRFQMVVAALIPAGLLLIRSSRILFKFTPGEIMGMGRMALIAALTLAPFCLVSGAMYTVCCSILAARENQSIQTAGTIYMWESAGAGLGGLLFGLLLFRWLHPGQMAACLSLINVITALLGCKCFHTRPSEKKRHMTVILLAAALSILLIAPFWESLSLKWLWHRQHLVRQKNTPYGNVAITRLGEQTSLFQNGLLTATLPDDIQAEESVHYTLLQHPAPERILMIGGGLNGSLIQILKHPTVKQVDYVELDPQAVALLQETDLRGHSQLNHPAIQVHFTDGRRFIRQTHQTFDVILINLPDPFTAQLNRFYTLEFFRMARKRLTPRGVFSITLASSENLIGPDLARYLSIEFFTLKQVFNSVLALPGETCRMMASQHSELTADADTLIQRLKARQLKTRYVREYYLPYHFSPDRLEDLASSLHHHQQRVNRDLQPVGFYFNAILWATTYFPAFQTVFRKAASWPPGFWHLAALLLPMTLALAARKREKRQQAPIFISVAVVGFTEITLEMTLLLSFQILEGYIYQFMAVIIACYMMGLTWGSGFVSHRKMTRPLAHRWFRRLQAAMIVFPLGLALLLPVLIELPAGTFINPLIFIMLAGGFGFIGGAQFPLGYRLLQKQNPAIALSAGSLYGFDLAGSAAGALLCSAFCIPILGISGNLILIAVLNISAWGAVSLKTV